MELTYLLFFRAQAGKGLRGVELADANVVRIGRHGWLWMGGWGGLGGVGGDDLE